jgi:hypothetical protein
LPDVLARSVQCFGRVSEVSGQRSAHSGPLAECREDPSGRFSNQHGQQPLHIEILDAKR